MIDGLSDMPLETTARTNFGYLTAGGSFAKLRSTSSSTVDHACSVSDLKGRLSSVRRSLARLRRKQVPVVWTARSVSW